MSLAPSMQATRAVKAGLLVLMDRHTWGRLGFIKLITYLRRRSYAEVIRVRWSILFYRKQRGKHVYKSVHSLSPTCANVCYRTEINCNDSWVKSRLSMKVTLNLGKHNQATMGEGELDVRVRMWFKGTLTAETIVHDGASMWLPCKRRTLWGQTWVSAYVRMAGRNGWHTWHF